MYVTVCLPFLRPSNEFSHLRNTQDTPHVRSPSIRRNDDSLSNMVHMNRRDRQCIGYRLERRN